MTRRGVALILVLLVLVVTTTAIAGAARLAVASRTHRHVTDHARVADAIRVGAEGFIDHFLRTESPRVVLPASARAPSREVLRDAIGIGGLRYDVVVVAYDQCGMVPWGHARPGSPLRAALPREVASAWDARPDWAGSPGLDELVEPGRVAGAIAYPGSGHHAGLQLAGAGVPVIGHHLATHNPEPAPTAGTAGTVGLINVNTAPRPLLAAALRAAGASGLDEILDARDRGQLAHAPPTTMEPPPGRASSIRLVGQSDCWSFRIDISTPSVRRSWWCVYRATGAQWRCVQRVAIGE